MWPGDLVFDPTWPSFKPDLEISKTNILSKIHDDCFKNVTARVLTRFSADLARWPSFDPKWPSFELDLELIKTNILSKFMMIASKLWPLECFQGFPLIWPGDLVFDPKWPSFELDLEIMKANILSTIHDDCFKNLTSRVLTIFSFDLTWWPSFLPQVTHSRKQSGQSFIKIGSKLWPLEY